MKRDKDAPKYKSTGFFTADHLRQMNNAVNHAKAKEIAHEAIRAQPDAHPINTKKAQLMVDGSKNKQHLLIGSANFMLAHPSEGLKVIKSEDERPEGSEE